MVKEVSVHASLRAKLVGGGNIKKGETEIHRTQFNNVHIRLEFYDIEKVSAMKIPKERRTYCPKCKKQTVHSISIYKKGKERTSALGARKHEEDRHGYGGQKFPELVRTAKTTKKQTLKLKCKECGYEIMKYGIRLRKLEIVA